FAEMQWEKDHAQGDEVNDRLEKRNSRIQLTHPGGREKGTPIGSQTTEAPPRGSRDPKARRTVCARPPRTHQHGETANTQPEGRKGEPSDLRGEKHYGN